MKYVNIGFVLIMVLLLSNCNRAAKDSFLKFKFETIRLEESEDNFLANIPSHVSINSSNEVVLIDYSVIKTYDKRGKFISKIEPQCNTRGLFNKYSKKDYPNAILLDIDTLPRILETIGKFSSFYICLKGKSIVSYTYVTYPTMEKEGVIDMNRDPFLMELDYSGNILKIDKLEEYYDSFGLSPTSGAYIDLDKNLIYSHAIRRNEEKYNCILLVELIKENDAIRRLNTYDIKFPDISYFKGPEQKLAAQERSSWILPDCEFNYIDTTLYVSNKHAIYELYSGKLFYEISDTFQGDSIHWIKSFSQVNLLDKKYLAYIEGVDDQPFTFSDSKYLVVYDLFEKKILLREYVGTKVSNLYVKNNIINLIRMNKDRYELYKCIMYEN